MSDVVLALRRNASTDPPEDDRIVLTEYGYARWNRNWGVNSDGAWTTIPDGLRTTVFVKPSWWLDMRPSAEPLTTDQLHLLMRYAEKNETYGTWDGWVADLLAIAAARLRAALDALDKP